MIVFYLVTLQATITFDVVYNSPDGNTGHWQDRDFLYPLADATTLSCPLWQERKSSGSGDSDKVDGTADIYKDKFFQTEEDERAIALGRQIAHTINETNPNGDEEMDSEFW